MAQQLKACTALAEDQGLVVCVYGSGVYVWGWWKGDFSAQWILVPILVLLLNNCVSFCLGDSSQGR